MSALKTVKLAPALKINHHILYGVNHKEVQSSLVKFVEKRINPFVDEWEEKRQFPARQLFKELGTLGIFGVNKPVEFGGLGLDFSYSIAVAQAMGTVTCGAIPMAASVQSDMATPALAEFGSDYLRKEFLAPSISGDKIACLGVSEHSAGSDVAGIKTYAYLHNGDLVINGSKMWITNGHQADWICLLLNTNTRSKSVHGNKSLVCVNMKEPGITLGRKIEKLGMHSSDTAEIFFDNVRVPLRNIIGEEGQGFVYQMKQFQNERLVAAAVVIEPLKLCIALTTKYALKREMFNRREFDHQVVQFKLAELSTEVEALESLVHSATLQKTKCSEEGDEDNQRNIVLASMAKLKAGRLCRKVTDECLQMWGGNGYCWENTICRLHRDLRLFSIAGGCDEVMLSIIARHLQKENQI